MPARFYQNVIFFYSVLPILDSISGETGVPQGKTTAESSRPLYYTNPCSYSFSTQSSHSATPAFRMYDTLRFYYNSQGFHLGMKVAYVAERWTKVLKVPSLVPSESWVFFFQYLLSSQFLILLLSAQSFNPISSCFEVPIILRYCIVMTIRKQVST